MAKCEKSVLCVRGYRLSKQPKERAMTEQVKEVSEKEFFKTIGKLDVHPTAVGKWPYTSLFKNRSGVIVGRIVATTDESGKTKHQHYI